MRNKRWLRIGLASVIAASGAAGAVLVACGDDDSSSGGVKPDSGTTDTGTNPTDSSTDQNNNQPDAKADAGQPPKLVFVNAATDLGTSNPLGAMRVCFATKTASEADFSPSPQAAAPTDGGPGRPAGIFIGTGGSFAGSGTPLQQFTIRPYLMNALALAQRGVEGSDPNTPRCAKLLTTGYPETDGGNTKLVPGVDYWQLADIPEGTLKQDRTYLLAVVGCTSDAQLTVAPQAGQATNCGDGFIPDGGPGTGNLKVLIMELAQDGVAANEVGFQNINLSPAHARAAGAAQTVAYRPTVGNVESQDGGTDAGKFAAAPGDGTVPYNSNATAPTALVKITGLVTDTGYWALAPNVGVGNVPAGPQALNNKGGVPSVQTLTTGSTDPNAQAIYVNGQSYTFVLIGDPAETSDQAARQTRKLHYLGFPNKQP